VTLYQEVMRNKIIKYMVGILFSLAVGLCILIALAGSNYYILFLVPIVFTILLAIFLIKSSNLYIFFIKIIFFIGTIFLVISIWIAINNNYISLFSEYSWNDIPNIKAIYYEISAIVLSFIFLFFGFYLLRLYKHKRKLQDGWKKEEQFITKI
jgi:hypothetical protein